MRQKDYNYWVKDQLAMKKHNRYHKGHERNHEIQVAEILLGLRFVYAGVKNNCQGEKCNFCQIFWCKYYCGEGFSTIEVSLYVPSFVRTKLGSGVKSGV